MPSNTARAPSDSSRQRRAHLKSRNGCVRCKRLRKKCDEGRPRCTRCVKQGTSCEYANAADGSDEPGSSVVSERRVTRDPDAEMTDSVSTDPTSVHTPAGGRSHASAADPAMPPAAHPRRGGGPGPGPPMLNARELELFSHYITHTSRVIPHGREDMFPLQVGMPNLAFANPAVMDSILALAASCTCHDMLGGSGSGSGTSDSTLGEICELLRLADRHHHAALGQLQNDIKERQFQSVLPNAALMVLYALSCHYVRVRLARRARSMGTALANDVLPFQSQWITSIRAAHVAFVGLLQPGLRSGGGLASPGLSAEDGDEEEAAELLGSSEAEYKFQDGPKEETRRLLLPIIVSTYEAALRKLRARNGDLQGDAKLEACGAALGLLEELFQVIVGGGDAALPRKDPPRPHDFGALDDVPPWLVRYLARVTSATPSRLWRRRIMAFLNQVPFDFLHLVQLALDCMPVVESLSSPGSRALPLEAAHKPAMDIFAHWLVLVMLLDGVWWIGDVGHWELDRIIRFIAAQGFALGLEEGETWWPEAMYAVKSTLGGAE